MKIHLIILFLFLTYLAKSQEGNNIVFGYKFGLNFSNFNPSTFQTIDDPWSSSACYSDKNGKLKFYINRDQIYNFRNNKIEGNDTALCVRSYSSFGCTYFINDLMDTNNIILFSTYLNRGWRPIDTPYYHLRNKNTGLYINVVNKIANNGDGKLVVQNKLVYKGYLDKLEMIRHKNRTDYWIIAQSDSNTFAVFLYSKNGLSAPSFYTINSLKLLYGSLKASNSGDALLYTGTQIYPISDSIKQLRYFECRLLNFDVNTGDISNGNVIDAYGKIENRANSSGQEYFFSCFSPNDSLIYLTTLLGNEDSDSSIFQFKRYAPIPSQTKLFIDPLHSNTSRLGKMVLAPNGKIYFGISQFCDTCLKNIFIPCIEKPNEYGLACKFNPKSVPVPVRSHDMFPSDVFYEYLKVNFIIEKQNCNTIKFSKDCNQKFTKFQWFFDDGDSTTDSIVSHTFVKTGLYNIKLKATTDWGYSVWHTDDLFITASPKATFITTSNQGCQFVNFNFINKSLTDTATNYNYTWLFGDGEILTQTSKPSLFNDTVSHVYKTSGTFSVKLIFNNGFCNDTFALKNIVNIIAAPKPGFVLSSHLSCTPSKINFKEVKTDQIIKKEIDFGSGKFQNININTSIDSSLDFNVAGTYVFKQRLTGSTGCVTYFEDTLIIHNGISIKVIPEMLNASFINDSEISINWQQVTNAVKYILLKDGKPLTTTRSFSYQDKLNSANFPSFNSYYKVIALDTCNNSSSESNIAKPVFISASNENNSVGLIRWTPYEKWMNGVINYELQYCTGGNKTWLSLKNLNSNTFNFTHNLLDSIQFDSHNAEIEICYRIIAKENQGNLQTSFSNTACVYLKPCVFIPNSFSPNNDGINDLFFPMGLGIEEYDISIYNRWGELIYKGNEVDGGWNGKIKNEKEAPEGIYIFNIHSVNKSADNLKKEFYLKGVINLIR